eukprot:1460750-Prymnesium_polylepis.2
MPAAHFEVARRSGATGLIAAAPAAQILALHHQHQRFATAHPSLFATAPPDASANRTLRS